MRVFVLYSTLAESQNCLKDHLKPLQRYRLAQLPWIQRLKAWIRWLYIFAAFLLSPLVIMYRFAVFALQIFYAVVAACVSWAIAPMLSNPLHMSRQQLVTAGYNVGHDAHSHEAPASDKLMPATEMQQTVADAMVENASNVSFSGSSRFSFSSSLGKVADSLQQPLILRFRRDIQALSAPAPQPRRTCQSIARGWLKLRLFVSQCDAAVDKWYLRRALWAEERVLVLDAQQKEEERVKAEQQSRQVPRSCCSKCCCACCSSKCCCGCLPCFSTKASNSSELQETHQQAVPLQLNVVNSQTCPVETATADSSSAIAQGNGVGIAATAQQHGQDVSANATATIPPKIVAVNLKLRRPREPWTLLWGHLHIAKSQQVILFY